MKPVKVLVLILLAIGLIRYNQSLGGADAKSSEAKPVDTKAQDIADLKAVEDRFMTAFRAKDKWLIAHTHVSFPVDLRTGQADTESKP